MSILIFHCSCRQQQQQKLQHQQQQAIIIIKSVEQYNWNLKLEIGYLQQKREQKCEEVAQQQQQHILFDYLFNERRSVWILLCGRMGMGTCMPYTSARVSAQRPIQFKAETRHADRRQTHSMGAHSIDCREHLDQDAPPPELRN